ncbi:MAG: CBS domain-containing protein [Pseudomonadales bacterium]
MFRKAGVKVSDHMVRRPVVVNPDTELFAAIHKISGVTVVDENRTPVGMLSELDCLRAILSGSSHQEDVGTILVKDHMNTTLETVSPDEQIIDVALSMLDHKHRRRPVVDQRGNFLG